MPGPALGELEAKRETRCHPELKGHLSPSKPSHCTPGSLPPPHHSAFSDFLEQSPTFRLWALSSALPQSFSRDFVAARVSPQGEWGWLVGVLWLLPSWGHLSPPHLSGRGLAGRAPGAQ